MKKISKRIATLFLALIMMVSVLPVQASAASDMVPSTYQITKYSSKDYDITGKTKLNKNYFTTLPSKITDLKSSNTKVVTVSKSKTDWSSKYYEIYLTAKKKGTATVSFKYKGKKYSTKVTVSDYKNPISSVKIGSTTIKGSNFKTRANYTLKYSKFKNKKPKVTIKLANGWEFSYKQTFEYMQNGWAKSDGKANKKTVAIKGGSGFAIGIPVTNTKTEQSEYVIIFFK